MHIAIFGAGISGIFTAYQAALQGFKVTLIEKNSLALQEASKQNGGQLSFSHILSISNIKLFSTIIKNLYSNNHPINLSFNYVIKDLNWHYNFIKNSLIHPLPYKELLNLSELSKDIFIELIRHKHSEVNLSKSGTLQIFRNKKSFEEALSKTELFAKFNIKYQIISSENISKFLPNTSNKQNIYKAIYFPNDMHGNAYDFSKSLLKSISSKIKFVNNATNIKFIHNNSKIINALINNQEINADYYILTPGSDVKEFNKALNINIPIKPLKGYSINHQKLNLKTSLIDHDYKIVYSPLNNYTRIAGLYDFHGNNKQIKANRMQFLLKNIENLFPNQNQPEYIQNAWCGLRPISVDKLPILGNSKLYNNLFYNLGHGNLGWTISAASAKVTIDNIINGQINNNFTCFAASRFSDL
jgi:D-amino-acid dehydrogenase